MATRLGKRAATLSMASVTLGFPGVRGAEGLVAGGVPGAAAEAFAEDAAAGAAEEPPVGRGAVAGQVAAQEDDEGRRDGHQEDGAPGAALEA
jgi:hypothetical protein